MCSGTCYREWVFILNLWTRTPYDRLLAADSLLKVSVGMHSADLQGPRSCLTFQQRKPRMA